MTPPPPQKSGTRIAPALCTSCRGNRRTDTQHICAARRAHAKARAAQLQPGIAVRQRPSRRCPGQVAVRSGYAILITRHVSASAITRPSAAKAPRPSSRCMRAVTRLLVAASRGAGGLGGAAIAAAVAAVAAAGVWAGMEARAPLEAGSVVVLLTQFGFRRCASMGIPPALGFVALYCLSVVWLLFWVVCDGVCRSLNKGVKKRMSDNFGSLILSEA